MIDLLKQAFNSGKGKMKLIKESERKKVLLAFGFSTTFLDAIDNMDSIDELFSNNISFPKGAYHYLPSLKNYSIYKGYNIVPICDVGQGDSFYTLLFNDHEQKIIYSEIEQDKVYVDYGLNYQAFIVKELIHYYDLLDDEEAKNREEVIEKIRNLGVQLGMDKTIVVQAIQRVFQAEDENENRFTSDQNWFEQHILPLVQ